MGAFPAQSREREANCSDSSPAERSARASASGVRAALATWGTQRRPARSLASKCQTNLDLTVRSAIFPNGATERQRSVAFGKWPCSRLLAGMACTHRPVRSIAVLLLCLRRQAKPRAVLLMPWPDEVSRPVRAAPAIIRARTICLLTVSPVCDRRNAMERKWSLRN